MSRTIFIAGASVRCAVDSAVRGGYTPLAADLFADYDLRQQCQPYRIEDYPAQLLAISRELPDVPWMYTGGLENHPRLVDQISRQHQLMGNPGNVLQRWRITLTAGSTLGGMPGLGSVVARAVLAR